MLRYVAIGAIAGFLVAYFLLSSPPQAVPVPAEAPQAAPVTGIDPERRHQIAVPINMPKGIGRMPSPPLQQRELPVAGDGG